MDGYGPLATDLRCSCFPSRPFRLKSGDLDMSERYDDVLIPCLKFALTSRYTPMAKYIRDSRSYLDCSMTLSGGRGLRTDVAYIFNGVLSVEE